MAYKLQTPAVRFHNLQGGLCCANESATSVLFIKQRVAEHITLSALASLSKWGADMLVSNARPFS